MLAQPYDIKRIKQWPVAVEKKLDGFRLLVLVDEDGDVQFLSRSGKTFTSLEHLRAPLSKVGRSVVLDGEVTCGSFTKTSGDVRRKSVQATDAVFTVFDAFSLNLRGGPSGKVLDEDTYVARRLFADTCVHLADHNQVVLSEMTLAYTEADIMSLYTEVRAQGGEGIIVKDQHAKYEYKRSYAWMKIKGYESADLFVTGVFAGEGKHEGRAGGFVCMRGNVEVRVGTGLTDQQRTDVWASRADMIGRLIEVGYHEVTPDGSLRHPRFIRFRDTLSPGDKE